MAASEWLCCCLDVATGSILAGVYSCFLSLTFLAIGIDSLVEVVRNSHGQSDMRTLNAVYGLLIGLSVLYGIGSVSLVLGASRKLKTYVILWIVLTPVWTILAICYLVVLPAQLPHAVQLTNLPSRVCGTVFVVIMNIFCLVCVCMFFTTLIRSPAETLRGLGVVEALETGFSKGYSRLRESIRPKKSSMPVGYRNKTPPTSAEPTLTGSVVLNPFRLEVSRTRSGHVTTPVISAVTVSENAKQTLPHSDQLDQSDYYSGLSNPGFKFED